METNKKTNDRELRFGSWTAKREAEQGAEDGYNHIEGKAVTFNDRTLLYPKELAGEDVYEQIERSAFDGADLTDVVLNVNHGDGNHAVARTRNGTLRLDVREDGVYVSADLDKKNPRCVQFYRDVESGLLDKMSFAFTITDQSFDEESSTFTIKSIGKLYDVSAVEHPAYENTSISASRSADLERLAKELEGRREMEAMRAEIRKKIEAIAPKGE